MATIHGNRTRGSTAKLTHNCCIFGIMGGTAPLTGVPLAHRAYLEKRAARKALCIQDCAQGHKYLKDHGILGCNPNMGGVGNMWRGRKYSNGSKPPGDGSAHGGVGPYPVKLCCIWSNIATIEIGPGVPSINGVNINGRYTADSILPGFWRGKFKNLVLFFGSIAGSGVTDENSVQVWSDEDILWTTPGTSGGGTGTLLDNLYPWKDCTQTSMGTITLSGTETTNSSDDQNASINLTFTCKTLF